VSDLALASRAEPFSAPGWLYELKHDGWRLLAAKDGDAVALRLRSGRDATSMFPEVAEAVAGLRVRRALLDGEVVVFAAASATKLRVQELTECGAEHVEARPARSVCRGRVR
jgi:ATP-dependent DNA ligase